jgi:CubicO group peptidase (beta-lactamase class C family)
MRRALTFLTAFVLSLASLAVGVFTADLPFWLRAMQLPRAADQLYLPVAAIGAAGTPPQAAASSVPVSVNAQTVQIDTAALESAVSLARDAGSRALLVMRDGEPLLARYFGADDDSSLLPAGLIARPVTAMAVGLALADAHLASLDEPVSRYLPEWDEEPRGRITLRQLLEDTSGLETGGDTRALLRQQPWHDFSRLPAFATAKGVRLMLGNDFARTALRFELDHESGGFFHASPANPQIAAIILERVTGVPFEEFVDQRVWRAAGAGFAELALDRRAGMPAAHCCWRASGPDVLRVVSLLATDGAYRGRQVLPASWVQEMARASRVNAGSGMQLARLNVENLTALSAGDDSGSVFWVIPERRLAIVNIVNNQGATPADLPALLLRALFPIESVPAERAPG